MSTVTTQAELDAALAAGEAEIIINSPAGVWLTLTDTGSSRVRASGSSRVTAYGSSRVRASGSSSVTASGSSRVTAYDSSSVTAYDSSRVTAYDSSSVTAYGSSRVTAYGSSRVTAYGSSRVTASDSSSVTAYDSSSVTAYDSSSVTAYDSSSVTAYDSSSVTAYDSSSVTAYGSSSVTAYGSSSVTASRYVAVHLHSSRATVQGGVVIDLTTLDLSDPQTWADYHGAHVEDGHVLVYKAVNSDLRSGGGFAYPLGETVTALDWQATDACGAGLHFGPTPRHARDYFPDATRFLACRIPLDEAKGITDGGVAKIKARSCEVLHEVDIDAQPLAAVTL